LPRVAVALPLALALSSCCADADRFESEAPACDDSFCGEPSVEVGTGALGYEALGEDAPVHLVFGPQGGYHLDVSARMDGLCPIVSIDVTLLADDGAEISHETHRVQAVRDGPGTVQDYWGLTALLPCGYWPIDGPYGGPNPAACPDGVGLEGQLEGAVATLVVEVEDDNGRTGRGVATVTPSCCLE
jgi:hypothetical protein